MRNRKLHVPEYHQPFSLPSYIKDSDPMDLVKLMLAIVTPALGALVAHSIVWWA